MGLVLVLATAFSMEADRNLGYANHFGTNRELRNYPRLDSCSPENVGCLANDARL
jgi:hypothetical protein